ncbi:UNVERIFIED_ORG: hypothetical protein J2740_001114 [Rhizobium nepotum]|nr:hypothetical protein [Rhizobium nepotum]
MSAGGEIFAPDDLASSSFENLIVDNVVVQIEGCKPGGIAARALAGVSGAATASGRGVKTHNSVLKSNSGWAIDPVAWARRAAATAKLMEQNDRIAEALQRAGEDVIRPGGVTLISAVTNVIETQRVFRAVRFLPVVAARDRRGLVNGLKLFIHEHPSAKYFRYAVMTCKEPVPAFGDLRGAIQELSRRISKWAHEVSTPDKNGECYDIEVLFRGIEFTRATAAERDAAAAERGQESDLSARYGADTALYHVHANVLYWPKRNIEKLWPEFLRYTEEFMGAHWWDNGRVEKVEEIVKYCSKPADTLAATDDELVWLYRQTQRLKICQPLREFRVWLLQLKKRREKVVRVHVGRGDGKLMRVKKGKRGGADDDPADEDGNVIEGDTVQAADDATDKDSDEAPESTPEKPTRLGEGGPAANVVIGLALPQWRHTPWAEPIIMVQNYDPLRLSTEDGADIREWQRQAREWWSDAFAPEPEEALRVARIALDVTERYAAWSHDGRMSDDDVDDARAALKEARAAAEDDIRKAAEAASYIVHTCSSTVRTGQAERIETDYDDLEVDERDISDDLAEVIAMFPGGRRVAYIEFESPEREKRQAELRESLTRREAWWAECRVSAAAREVERARQAARWAEWCARSAANCRAAA